MVMTEHQDGDALFHGVDGEEMENGPVIEQDRDAEAPHEQTEDETVGLISRTNGKNMLYICMGCKT